MFDVPKFHRRPAWLGSLLVFTFALMLVSPAAAQETTPEATAAADIVACPMSAPADFVPSLKVLTTFTILSDMASNVACGYLEVDSITKVGAEIHGYEPTPSDVAKAQDADLVIYNGLGLERWFEKFMTNVQDVTSINASDGVDLIPIAEGDYIDKPNPHAWMSPKNAHMYVDNMLAAFIALDPEHEAQYTANATAYSAQLDAVDTFLRENLATVPVEQRFLVSCEGAFSYLTRDYELQELYMWPINADQTGTPKQIAKVIDNVQNNGIPAVFCESTVNNDPMLAVSQQTGARFGGMMYVDSITGPDGEAPTYLKLLERDAQTLVTGLLGQ
jgi:ABC-type Zn uptake system ZnuABC Zn-binding protein ZnuA